FVRLILDVRGLLKFLVVVDAEGSNRRQIGSQTTDLRIEEARRNAAGSEKCRQAMKIGQTNTNRGSVNLGTVPSYREEYGSVQEIAEVIPIVRVLPKIVGVHDEIFSKCLLETRMEF